MPFANGYENYAQEPPALPEMPALPGIVMPQSPELNLDEGVQQARAEMPQMQEHGEGFASEGGGGAARSGMGGTPPQRAMPQTPHQGFLGKIGSGVMRGMANLTSDSLDVMAQRQMQRHAMMEAQQTSLQELFQNNPSAAGQMLGAADPQTAMQVQQIEQQMKILAGDPSLQPQQRMAALQDKAQELEKADPHRVYRGGGVASQLTPGQQAVAKYIAFHPQSGGWGVFDPHSKKLTLHFPPDRESKQHEIKLKELAIEEQRLKNAALRQDKLDAFHERQAQAKLAHMERASKDYDAVHKLLSAKDIEGNIKHPTHEEVQDYLKRKNEHLGIGLAPEKPEAGEGSSMGGSFGSQDDEHRQVTGLSAADLKDAMKPKQPSLLDNPAAHAKPELFGLPQSTGPAFGEN